MTEDRHANALHADADVREPTDAQINVWWIIRSALSRAFALSRPWAVVDRPRLTSEVAVARLDAIATDCEREVLAALRSEAQGEEDVGEVCHLCGEEFDPRESGTVTGPLGQDDGVPRWYRCPRCARAYDAGYQQGQRDPRNDARQGEPRSAVEIYETTVNDSGTLVES